MLYREDIDPLLAKMAHLAREITSRVEGIRRRISKEFPPKSRWEYLIEQGYNPRDFVSYEDQARITKPLDQEEGRRFLSFLKEQEVFNLSLDLLKTSCECMQLLAAGELRGRLFKENAADLQTHIDAFYQDREFLLSPDNPKVERWASWANSYFTTAGEAFAKHTEQLLRTDYSLTDLKNKFFKSSKSKRDYLFDIWLALG